MYQTTLYSEIIKDIDVHTMRPAKEISKELEIFRTPRTPTTDKPHK